MNRPFNDLLHTDLEDITKEEHDKYLDFVAGHNGGTLDGIARIVVTDRKDGDVDIRWHTKNDVPFERIRRITGYLVGTIDRWNDAKKAEESERVKHA